MITTEVIIPEKALSMSRIDDQVSSFITHDSSVKKNTIADSFICESMVKSPVNQ